MSKEFMIARDGQQYGPYSTEDLLQYLKDGQVSLDDLVWSEGMDDWRSLREVRDQLVAASITKADQMGQNDIPHISAATTQRTLKKTIFSGKKYQALALIIVLAAGGFYLSSNSSQSRQNKKDEKLWLTLHGGVEGIELTPDGKLSSQELSRICTVIALGVSAYAREKDTDGKYDDLFSNTKFFIEQYPKKDQKPITKLWNSYRAGIDRQSNFKPYYAENNNFVTDVGAQCMDLLDKSINNN